MLLLWTSLVIAAASCHKVVESTEDIGPETFKNTTKLHPVSNNTDSSNSRIKSATSWKIETTFGESNFKSEDSNSTDSREDRVVEKNNSSQEFKPSPHVGNFFESLEVVPTRETLGGFSNVFKKPHNGFVGSHKHLKSPINKIPKDIFKNYSQFPYKLESPILTRAKDDWKPSPGPGTLESKPTEEVPVRVPAGSLYKAQDPFKDKPDGEFGLEFSGDFKDEVSSLKKRSNPWKKLLYLITSLIPVGLIFSALTPNVITIQPTGSEGQYPSTGNIFRRADGTVHPIPPPTSISPPAPFAPPGPPKPPNLAVPPTQLLPPISERCRRRLLCELQNDAYYAARSSRHPRQCHRIPCEDRAALASTLNYLLHYQQVASAAFQQRLQSSGDTLNVADHFT